MSTDPDAGLPSLSGRTGGPLLKWFDKHKRELPWRQTKDPYAIWVSEIMLQQTQVVTVIPYFDRWMSRFPTVAALAAADEQEVLSLWQGLGYYRRCRLLLEGARQVASLGVPGTVEGWLGIPGIGRYTAGAIASIALELPAPVVDGNVERVYARLVGDASAGPELNAAAWKWAGKNLFKKRPGDWNQALMELGATVCKPVAPDCRSCPLSGRCVAFQSWRIDELPTKPPKVKIVRLRHAVWVPVFEGRFGLRQIPAGQWWEGMWEFPRADADGLEPALLRQAVGPGWPESLGVVKHTVTNHRISIEASFVRCESQSPGLRWLAPEDLKDLPMPAPQRRILKLVLAHLGHA
jgi:A/G-specific adenine glycosylase